MQDQVDAILAELQAGLDVRSEFEPLLSSVLAKLRALSPVTDADRCHHLLGYVRFYDTLLPLAGPEEAAKYTAERDRLMTFLMRRYGSVETPYIRSRAVVERLAHSVRQADAAVDDLVDEALAELNALEFDEEDSPAKLTATLCLQAIQAERNWQSVDDTSRDESNPLVVMLRRLQSALANRGFDREAVLETATSVRERRLGFGELAEDHAVALLIVLGIGLQSEPNALPALEPVCDLLLEAMVALEQPPPPDFASRCESVLAELERGLREEGFSEYLFRQCSAGLEELEPDTEDESRTLRAALVRMIDMSVPHAPSELAQTLLVSREAMVLQDAPPQEPLDAGALKAEGEAILRRLKDGLAAGKPISPEIVRAFTSMQRLFGRLADDAGEEVVVSLLGLPEELLAVAASYASPALQDTAQDLVTFFSQIVGPKGLMRAKRADAIVEQQALRQDVARFTQSVVSDPWDQPDAEPHQRQFVALLRSFMGRIHALESAATGERDATEIERLSASAKVAFNRLQPATTEKQMVEQQRRSFRRVAVELRQFERRHHLMLVEPPWPSPPVSVDVNAAFFSGSAQTQVLVDDAIRRIGMAAAMPQVMDHAARGRWEQLRRSAVAVFDFTAYDRAASDPPGALPRSRKMQDAILRAAAPVARVAYECGWAFVLGTPFLTVVTQDRTMPFDIDIEPVRINGGPDDAARLVENLQAALYGVQRGSLASDLSETLQELAARFGGAKEIAALLEPLAGTGDAIHVQLVAAAACERIGGYNLMLTLPAFPPAYPSRDGPDGRRALFHVTAFRDWSHTCQTVVREACSDKIEYRIGYERLNPDILRAIWNDLCRASFVVADLTNLNPNAVLELSIAQALGKPTLIVTQSPDIPTHLPALEHVRIHAYSTGEAGRGELARLVERFLASSAPIT